LNLADSAEYSFNLIYDKGCLLNLADSAEYSFNLIYD
jgi:hypothetical protein